MTLKILLFSQKVLTNQKYIYPLVPLVSIGQVVSTNNTSKETFQFQLRVYTMKPWECIKTQIIACKYLQWRLNFTVLIWCNRKSLTGSYIYPQFNKVSNTCPKMYTFNISCALSRMKAFCALSFLEGNMTVVNGNMLALGQMYSLVTQYFI